MKEDLSWILEKDQRVETCLRKTIKQQCSLPYVRCTTSNVFSPYTINPLLRLSQTIGFLVTLILGGDF